jgi:hypothetical protein
MSDRELTEQPDRHVLRPRRGACARPRVRRGMAVILVLIVVAVAMIIGMAMISSSALQSQVSGSANSLLTADSFSESGISMATYYLMNPDKAPTLNSDGWWAGTTTATPLGVSAGSLDSVTVTLIGQPSSTVRRYEIASTASAGSPATTQRVSRTTKATVDVTGRYVIKNALSANGNLTIPVGWTMNVQGDTRVDGNYTSFSVGNLVGSLFSRDASNPQPASYPPKAAPTLSQLRIVQNRPYYTYQGATYTAELLSANVSNATLQTANTVTNPANVWYSTATRTLGGSVTIPGTLMVVGTTSSVKIAGNVRITPKSGMPGLIVEKDIQYSGLGRKLRVDGVMWVGNNVTTDGLSASGTLEVYGALMFGGTTPSFGSLLLGSATIQFDATNVNNLPSDFSTSFQTPQSIKVQTWSP